MTTEEAAPAASSNSSFRLLFPLSDTMSEQCREKAIPYRWSNGDAGRLPAGPDRRRLTVRRIVDRIGDVCRRGVRERTAGRCSASEPAGWERLQRRALRRLWLLRSRW